MPTSTSSRETRQHALEVKFLIRREMAAEIRDWARRHLGPDVHGGGTAGDEYRITSLYCDTTALDVFHRRGSFGRAKYRIRRYGLMPDVFLERKLRTDRLLAKRRTLVPTRDLVQLGGNEPIASWAGKWFHDRLRSRGLLPRCQVSYRRMARVADTAAGVMRLTIDDDLRATLAADFRFDDARGTALLLHHVIVELKFLSSMPPLFQLFAEHFELQPAALSKYRLAMSTLLGPPAPTVSEPAQSPEAMQQLEPAIGLP